MNVIRKGSKVALSWIEGEQDGPVELFVLGDREQFDAKHELNQRLATISLSSDAGKALEGKKASVEPVEYRHDDRMFAVRVVKILDDDEIALEGEVISDAV